MRYRGTTDEYFEILEINNFNKDEIVKNLEGQLSIIWFEEDNNLMTIDAENYDFKKDELIFLTSFHKIQIEKLGKAKFLRFNSPFYCILDHDSEVSCKGILFFGSSTLPIIKAEGEDLQLLETVWKMVILEMNSKDNLQLEMLQMMLKRLLILCTRIYKLQANYEAIEKPQVDIVREFNFLVEQHFKVHHTVSEYAKLLNKSPKTLSNMFGKLHDKSPSQLIQNRIMLEAKRMLRYSERPISDIGYDLGFNDIQSFSRFFKKHAQHSPTEFRVI